MLKRILIFTLIAVLMVSSSFTYAATTQSQTDWKDSLSRLSLLGIVDEADLNVNGNITRAQFSKIIVNSTGNYELAKSLAGSTTFSDVSSKSAYCGYINAAVNKGFLSAYSDGNFKPDADLTFAQLCTAVIKALGYAAGDIVGAWPNGYTDKAKNLGITTGFSYSSNSPVKTTAAITMIERMLNTNIKKVNAQDADKTLLDAVGLMDDQSNWVYGKPEIAINFNPAAKKLGSITFNPGIPVLRDTTNNSITPAEKVVGETISLNDIKDKDAVYEVYNKLNVLIYYLVVDNKIDGQITSILPNKYSPKKIQINNVDYDLGEYAKLSKFNSGSGSFNVGDTVSAVLGYDGKIVDAYYAEDSNNKDYAFVVNASTMVSKDAADYGKIYYTVELMFVDGTRKTCKITEDPNRYKWKLVRYSFINDDTVALLDLPYITPAEKTIDRYEKKVDQSYITDNIKIFNYTDSTVSLLKWTDIPDGKLPSGKIVYMGTTGDFGDINVLLTNDVLNQQYKNYVVQRIQVPDGKKTATYTYSLVSGSDQYSYTSKTEVPGAVVGSVFSMKMFNNAVSSFNSVQNPEGQGWYVQAIDSKRIKMNEWIYMFGSDVTFYVKDYSDNLTAKKLTDITVGTELSYGNIRIYCDRPMNNGGKVQYIIFSLK